MGDSFHSGNVDYDINMAGGSDRLPLVGQVSSWYFSIIAKAYLRKVP